MSLFRRRRIDRALIAKLAAENAALRVAVADLGRQLHQAQRGPLGDTVPMPRVRSLTPAPAQWHTDGDLVTPWPPAPPAGL